MAKNEAKTDLWVHELLQEANIHLTPQGCDIKEIAEALKRLQNQKQVRMVVPNIVWWLKILFL